MREELTSTEIDTLRLLGNVLYTLKDKYSGGRVLKDYECATVLLCAHRSQLIDLHDLVEFRYDLDSNHVLIDDVSKTLLKELGLTENCQFLQDPIQLGDRIKYTLHTLGWPKYLKVLYRYCFEDSRVTSILNFICGCRYWNASNMYHLICGKSFVKVSEAILYSDEISPVCYLSDVPNLQEDMNDYIELFKRIRGYIEYYGNTEHDLVVYAPDLTGIITDEMFELADIIENGPDSAKARAASKLRHCYLSLTDLAVCMNRKESIFYDCEDIE